MVVDYSSSLMPDFIAKKALAKNKDLWIISQSGTVIPTDIKNIMFTERPENIDSSRINKFIEQIEMQANVLSKKLALVLFDQPLRLLGKKEYRAAVISAFVILENKLNELAQPKQIKGNFSWARRWNPRQLREQLVYMELITKQDADLLGEWTTVRNQLVHTQKNISKQEATKIVLGIQQFIENISA